MNPVRNQNIKLIERTKIQKSSGLAVSNGVKKILFIVTQSEFGGAQRYVFELVTHLDTKKYEILVAAGSPSQILSGKTWEGKGNGELFEKISNLKTQNSKLHLKTQNLRYLKRTPLPWQIIFSIKEILNLLRKEKPNVLFLCSSTAGLLGSIAAKIYKIEAEDSKLKIIYRIGGWSFRDPRPVFFNWILILLEKITSPFKDKIIVNSDEDFKLALKYSIAPAKKLVKIYNGIDINSLNFLSKEEARKKLFQLGNLTIQQFKNLTIVGCVANFYKTKGLEYLIEAIHLLNTKYTPKQSKAQNQSKARFWTSPAPKRSFWCGVRYGVAPYKAPLLYRGKILNTKYLIIGEGKERPRLELLIKKYNLENTVFLLGRVPDAHKYLKAFDIFVLPSLKEGFPWIILEAMAAEIPIVATRVGALPEIIEDKKEGLLVKPKNSQALVEKTLWFLKHQKKTQEMTINAREKLKKFTLEKMIEETEKILNE